MRLFLLRFAGTGDEPDVRVDEMDVEDHAGLVPHVACPEGPPLVEGLEHPGGTADPPASADREYLAVDCPIYDRANCTCTEASRPHGAGCRDWGLINLKPIAFAYRDVIPGARHAGLFRTNSVRDEATMVARFICVFRIHGRYNRAQESRPSNQNETGSWRLASAR
jgi:hypothetical protein